MSASVYAVGLGGINVVSSLGEPLKADIQLVSLSESERGQVSVRLASPEMYRGAGLEYPRISDINFQIRNLAEGGAVLKVSTEDAVNEPFVNLLVELKWPAGRLLREYTFLLDPPGYTLKQPPMPEVRPLTPALAGDEGRAAGASAVTARSTVISSRDGKGAAEGGPVAGYDSTATAVVRSGDTLRKLAQQNKPANVSLERMLVALYRANVDQFDGQNMNRIQVGKVLRMPTVKELDAITQREAVKSIRVQVSDWHAYRQRLAGAAATSQAPAESVQQASEGVIAGQVEDSAPVVEPDAGEVLRLSQGEAPDDSVSTDGAPEVKPGTVADSGNAAQEEAIAIKKAKDEAEMRADLLEQNLKDIERLEQLKRELAATLDGGESGEAVNSETPAVKVDKPVEVEKPAAAKPPVTVEPEGNWLDDLLSKPYYLGGGAALLVGLIGAIFFLRRRKEDKEEVFDEEEIASNEMTPPIITMPSGEHKETSQVTTGDETVKVASLAEEPSEDLLSDDVDPLSEAELFLNFGRDVQAEEVLKEALNNSPENHEIHLKLLGIYAERKDTNSFMNIARQLQASGDEPAWNQAAAMGRRIDPENPFYGEGGDDDALLENTGSATVQAQVTEMEPDFVLDDGSSEGQSASPELDFDLGGDSALSAEQTMVISKEEEPMSSTELDFDLTASNPQLQSEEDADEQKAQSDSAITEASDLDFDLGEERPAEPGNDSALDVASTPVEEPAVDDLSTLDLDMTDDEPAVSENKAQDKAEFSTMVEPLADLELDEGAAATKDVSVPDVAVEASESDSGFDDLVLPDSDTSASEHAADELQPAAEEAKLTPPELDDVKLDFDDEPSLVNADNPVFNEAELEEAPAAAVEEPAADDVKSEAWHEVATKLDLATAYQEMGDATGAREILDEVLLEGDDEQQQQAREMLEKL